MDTTTNSNITHINLEIYNELLQNSDDLYMVDFWAAWCGPCKAMNPFIEKISQLEKYQGKLKVGKVDTDENPELSMQYKITGIPCFVFIKFDAQTKTAKEVARLVGAKDYISFVTEIDKIIVD